jgi:spore maturation protein CgeB/glycosyltransferase involved in cell wall biosynthesis
MKILFFAPDSDEPNKLTGSYGYHNIKCPLEDLGFEVVDFNFSAELKLLGHEAMNQKLKSVIDDQEPDIFLHAIVESELDRSLAGYIRDLKTTTSIVLFSDDDWRFDHSLAWLDLYNFAVTTCREAWQKYQKLGYKQTILSQWGCNPNLYFPIKVSQKQYDVTFVGQLYPGRLELISFLKDSGINVKVWGHGWDQVPSLVDIAGGYLTHEDMLSVFSSSKICLGMAWCSTNPQQPQIKGRTFEYAACQVFQLTNYDERLKDFFVEGKEIVFYQNFYDLVEKINHYLFKETEREEIALSAYRRTIRDHTWSNRYFRILTEIVEMKKKKNYKFINLDEIDIPLRSILKDPNNASQPSRSRRIKVSVVTYVFNGERYIGECIESILQQTYTNFELLILDDGSTDRTRSIIEEYTSDTRIRYIYQENVGKTGDYSRLANKVVQEAAGDLIAFIGADDVCLPNRLEVQLQQFESDSRLDVVFSDGYHIDENGNILKTSFGLWHPQSKLINQWNLLRTLFSRNIVAHPTTMLRRSSILNMGGFEGGFVADYHFWLKSASHLNYSYIDQPLIKYRIHSRGASTAGATENQVIPKTIELLESAYQKSNINDLYPEIQMCSDINAAKYSAYLQFGNLMLAEATFSVPSIAAHAYEQAILVNPTRVEALYNLTIASLISGDFEKANRCFRKLIFLSETVSINSSLIENIENVISTFKSSSDISNLSYLQETADTSELLSVIATREHSPKLDDTRCSSIRMQSARGLQSQIDETPLFHPLLDSDTKVSQLTLTAIAESRFDIAGVDAISFSLKQISNYSEWKNQPHAICYYGPLPYAANVRLIGLAEVANSWNIPFLFLEEGREAGFHEILEQYSELVIIVAHAESLEKIEHLIYEPKNKIIVFARYFNDVNLQPTKVPGMTLKALDSLEKYSKFIALAISELSLEGNHYFFSRYVTEYGIPVMSFPWGVNIYSHVPAPVELERDLFFIGTFSEKASRFQDFWLEPLKKYNYLLIGPDWTQSSFKKAKNSFLTAGEFNRKAPYFYSSSAIALNLHHAFEVEGFTCNERVFNAPACGGFVVSDRVRRIRDFFGADEVVMAGNPSEYLEAIEYFVQYPERRYPYMRKAIETLYRHHTYHHRLADLLAVVFSGRPLSPFCPVMDFVQF